jgi:hypothetical protein
MLRVHLPATFKTPGTSKATTVNAHGGSNIMICDEDVIASLIQMRRKGLG